MQYKINMIYSYILNTNNKISSNTKEHGKVVAESPMDGCGDAQEQLDSGSINAGS
jgi:hypothetical protein